MATHAKMYGNGEFECLFLDETQSLDEISVNDKGLVLCNEIREDSDTIKFDGTNNILHVSEISEVYLGG